MLKNIWSTKSSIGKIYRPFEIRNVYERTLYGTHKNIHCTVRNSNGIYNTDIISILKKVQTNHRQHQMKYQAAHICSCVLSPKIGGVRSVYSIYQMYYTWTIVPCVLKMTSLISFHIHFWGFLKWRAHFSPHLLLFATYQNRNKCPAFLYKLHTKPFITHQSLRRQY